MDLLPSIVPAEYDSYGFPSNNMMKVKNVYYPKKPCIPTIEIKGKTYYVRVDCSAVSCPRINRVQVDKLDLAENGRYTYMLYKEAGEYHIAYVKVQSAMEFGSLHKTLFYEVRPEELLIAGEFRKVDNLIQYNFLSGTYALPIFERRNITNQGNAYAKQLTPFFQSLYPSLTFQFTTKTIIPGTLKVTVEEIRELEAKGFDVALFEDKGVCNECSSSMEGHLASIAMYEDSIKKEREGMKKNPKLYQGYSIPRWEAEIARLQAILARCAAPPLRLTSVMAGGKRKTRRTYRKKHYKRPRTLKH